MENQRIKRQIPEYIDCLRNTMCCNWYIHKECQELCPYALGIKGIGIGAMDKQTLMRLEEKLENDI